MEGRSVVTNLTTCSPRTLTEQGTRFCFEEARKEIFGGETHSQNPEIQNLVIREHGLPKTIRVDQGTDEGTKFISGRNDGEHVKSHTSNRQGGHSSARVLRGLNVRKMQ